MSQLNNKEMTEKIKAMLNIFDRVGVATKERFENTPEEYHPKNLLEGFESIIVYAEGKKEDGIDEMGGFSDYLGTIAAQSDVISHLNSLGYKAVIIEGTSRDVSLVRMGVEAGVGELSPVNSLVVKGFGLTTSLGAIITDASLVPDKKVSGVCIKCMKCLKVCPIRDVQYAKGDLSKCACGKCRNICPV
ncbi:MAG: (Fe-S)-binding protein [Clostridiales bacterium]|jgi:epoxyqueuosine reductase QueG|nr:(Fe-S)-binding protein [Clostridiales bacterium]